MQNVTFTTDSGKLVDRSIRSVITDEDGQYITLEIQLGDKISDIHNKAAETLDRFDNFIFQSLNGLLEHVTRGKLKTNAEPLPSTPTARKVAVKRAVPNSSSTNKILIHRAKRIHSASSQKSSVKQLFKQKTVKETFEGTTTITTENYLELMSELSFDNKNISETQSSNGDHHPLIKQDNSLVKLANSNKDVSKINDSTVVMTRSRTKLASEPKQSNAVKKNATDLKVKPPTAAATPKAGTFYTPQSQKSKLINPAVNKATLTPIQKRQEILQAKKQALVMSEDKKKKADANRQAYLDNKKMALKIRAEKRERQLATFREKQRQVELDKKENLKKKTIPPASKPAASVVENNSVVSAREKRQLDRKKRLENLSSSSSNLKIHNSSRTNVSKKVSTSTSNLRKVNNSKSDLKQNSASKKVTSKANLEPIGTVVDHKRFVSAKHEDLLTSDESVAANSDDGKMRADGDAKSISKLYHILSPVKPAAPNVAITAKPAPPPALFAVPSLNVTNTVHNSTQLKSNSTFNCAPATSVLNSTFNKTVTKLQNMNSYQMTPPPKPHAVSTYDISAYIDSDDEEANQQRVNNKPIPNWAQGKEFINLLRKQFSLSTTELETMAQNLFSNQIQLPIPLDEMGLIVRANYATRSSSVTWNEANLGNSFYPS